MKRVELIELAFSEGFNRDDQLCLQTKEKTFRRGKIAIWNYRLVSLT
jgi:hypothetical protein